MYISRFASVAVGCLFTTLVFAQYGNSSNAQRLQQQQQQQAERQREAERERQAEQQRERAERQREAERERQAEQQRDRVERQREAEKERQADKQRDARKESQAEVQRQRAEQQREAEKQSQQQRAEQQRDAEKARQAEQLRERADKQAEVQRQRAEQQHEAERQRQQQQQRVAQEREAEKERQQQRVTQAREAEKERQAEKLRAVQEREAEKERQQQRARQAREAEKERQLGLQRQQQQSVGTSQQQQQNSLTRSGLPSGATGAIADQNRVGIQPGDGLAPRPQLYAPPPTSGRPQVGYGDNAYRPLGTPPRDISNETTQSATNRLMPQALASGQASADTNRQPAKTFTGYQTPVVTMSPSQPSCPPGSSPARHANGTYVAIPPTSICIKNEQHTPGLDDLRNRNGENNSASTATVGQRSAASNGNAMFADSDLYCNQPGRVHNGSIACIEPKCQPGQVKSKGQCVTPTIVCQPPNTVEGNRCVPPPAPNNGSAAPTNAASGSGGSAGSPSGGKTGTQPGSTKRNPGRDAAGCVSDNNNGVLTNNCGAKIFVIYCGELMYSKKTCGSGSKGQFFTHSHNLDAGAKETIHQKSGGRYRWAACYGGISFGNDGEYVDTPQGGYTCLER